MVYSSDYSSEEEEDVEEENESVWNPSELLEELNQTTEEKRKKELQIQLFTLFLNQQRPILSSKMKDFLLEEGIPQILISFLIQLDEKSPSIPKVDSQAMKQRRKEGSDDEERVIRSYRLMELFHNPMVDLVEILQPNLQIVLSEMFKIVEENSRGNFYHFHKILMRFLSRCPEKTTYFLLSSGLIWKLFDEIHEPAVADSLLGFFCISFPKHNDTLSFYKIVVEHRIHERIGNLIYGVGNTSKAIYASDFFVRLLEKLSSQELAANLFLSICRTSDFLDGLFNAIVIEDGTFSESQKLGCANVLKELLLKSGEKALVQHAFARPIPNMLAAIHGRLHELASKRVETISEVLVRRNNDNWKQKSLKLSSFEVKRPIGSYLFTLLEILGNLVSVNPSRISQISTGAWKVLSNWFIEHTYNNLYHSLFVKIFRTLMLSTCEEEQRQLLQKQKFLSRLLDNFKKPDIGNKGFIIIITNIIRLMSDSLSPHTLLHQFFNSHDGWKSFIPLLKELTLAQIMPYQDLEDEEQDFSLELGSTYAKSIGITLQPFTPSGEIVKKKKKKKKKSKSHALLVADAHSDQTSKEDKTAENWWKELTATLESNAPQKQEDPTSDWWQDLKEELNQLTPNSETVKE
eukprot:TRINITY_DN5201_c0_g1_i1.p1 TRINITY_DN5201_c0_g1~~TRINITY_DN5201_c0_g1_i1.p1  ORF type:complete len:678 (-),score=106.26 TRINITY_DN5201_c0_g1_i1:74-1969(-)